MKLTVWVGLAAALATAPLWAGETPLKPASQEAPSLFAENTRDFDRNTALGVALTMRPARPAELKELQALADRGLKAAQEAVVKYPESGEAHYLLGSWLLYGYCVRDVREIVVGPQGGGRAEIVPRVVQGLKDEVDSGLAALRRATELEPSKGRYLIDYGAALYDCQRLSEALGYLKAVWANQPELTPSDKLEIAILLSRVYEDEGLPAEAREWVYSGLEANPENAAVVEHLRWLDKALPEAEAAASQAMQAVQDLTDDTVYKTTSGQQYHRADCRYLSGSGIPISRREARAQGLTPCSVCKPDEGGAGEVPE